MKTALPLILLLTLASCRWLDRPEPGLPPITSRGANSFGCLIDGELFRPKSPYFWSRFNRGLAAFITDSSVYLIANRIIPDDSVDIGFTIQLDRVSVGDTIWLGSEPNDPFFPTRSAHFHNDNTREGFSTWNEDSLTFSGYVLLSAIEIIPDSTFASGVFEFRARNRDSTRIIEVTQGRFDARNFE